MTISLKLSPNVGDYYGENNPPNLSNGKRGKEKNVCKKLFFSRKFQIAIAQKLLGILKIRLQIRNPRTRFSLKRKCLINEMPKFVRKIRFKGFLFFFY